MSSTSSTTIVDGAGALAATRASPASNAARIESVVGEHYEFVWRSLRRLGVSEANADDATQDVFCVFAKRADDVPRGKEKSFLFGVASKVATNARRRERRHDAVGSISAEEVLATTPADEQGADQLVDDRRARAILDALLSTMAIELREVFVLYEIEEMTMAEIARVLDLPSGTVASRLRRARQLFEHLSREAKEAW